MQYFVSIENTSYFLWQIELLIESFKKHNLEDNLVIAIADNHEPVAPEYKFNLLNHKNKFTHPDSGELKCRNKLTSLWLAVEKEVLKPPFTIIHPDMVLYKPIEEDFSSDIVFSIEEETNLTYSKFLSEYINQIKTITNMEGEIPWLPIGGVIVLNNVPKYFFEKLIINLNKLIKEKQPNDPAFKIEKAAWILTVLEAASSLLGQTPGASLGTRSLEHTLMHHGIFNNFVHYKHGLAPDWSKYQFKFGPLSLMGNEDGPYDSLLKKNGTTSTDYVCGLIRSYKERITQQA